jgi:hypothetical protein
MPHRILGIAWGYSKQSARRTKPHHQERRIDWCLPVCSPF